MMKLWVDDVRPAPDDTWTVARTSADALSQLATRDWDIVSLDHDLGFDDTTRVIVLWMCRTETWPDEIRVHSMNPIGRSWLIGMIERYRPVPAGD